MAVLASDGLANIALHWLRRMAAASGLECDEKYRVFFEGEYPPDLADSESLEYRVLGRHHRPSSMARNGNEMVDITTISRFTEKHQGYRPTNLDDFLNR